MKPFMRRKAKKSVHPEVSKFFAELGSRTSPKKAKASAENGKKGGRPRKEKREGQ